MVSIAVIVFLTYVNTKGIKAGKTIQTIFTSTKLLALFGLIIFGFFVVKESFWEENWKTGFNAMQDLGSKDASGALQPVGWQSITGFAVLGAVVASMTGSIFSSDAWNNVTFIAGEIKNPKRNVGLSLFFGTLIVSFIYIATNLMLFTCVAAEQSGISTGRTTCRSCSKRDLWKRRQVDHRSINNDLDFWLYQWPGTRRCASILYDGA